MTVLVDADLHGSDRTRTQDRRTRSFQENLSSSWSRSVAADVGPEVLGLVVAVILTN